MSPIATERFSVQFTIGKEAHDALRDVQALLSHQLPSGDIAQVFERAIVLLKGHLQKQKHAATAKPRPRSRRASSNPRLIPADVRRAVWERDQGRCAFIGEGGQRCVSRKFLEYDHVDPVARGGQATADNVRLLCRAHNAFEAERVFGAGFISEKREAARRSAAMRSGGAARATKGAAAVESEGVRPVEVAARPQAPPNTHTPDALACLRELGYRPVEARRAMESCAALTHATLEELVRAALRFLCPGTGLHDRSGRRLGVPA